MNFWYTCPVGGGGDGGGTERGKICKFESVNSTT